MRDWNETMGQNNQDVSNVNKSALLKFLRQNGVCSRAQISKAMGLTQASISKITAQLLEEDGQGLGGPQEQHGVDLRDVHTLVVDVHHEDEAHLTADQSPFGGLSLLIGGFSGQENGRDSAAVEIAAHKLRMLNRHAEAQALDLVDVGHILEKGGHHQIGAAVGHGAAEGVEIGKLIFVVAAGTPFQGVQIHRVGDAEICRLYTSLSPRD